MLSAKRAPHQETFPAFVGCFCEDLTPLTSRQLANNNSPFNYFDFKMCTRHSDQIKRM